MGRIGFFPSVAPPHSPLRSPMCPKPSGRLLDDWTDRGMYAHTGSGLVLQEADWGTSGQDGGWFWFGFELLLGSKSVEEEVRGRETGSCLQSC